MSSEVRPTIQDGVATLTLANPGRRNAMDLDLAAKVVAVLDEVVADENVRAVVLTGEPPSFCAGGDLTELQDADHERLRSIYSGFLAVARCPLPTIAAVNGAAVGAGLNLALACDVLLAGPTARFDVRFLQLGLHPGGGFTWMIERALGGQGARAMTLFGDVLDATEAERTGLVWRRYDSDDALLTAARELAERAASVPRSLLETTKATMRLTAGPLSHDQATEIEVRAQAVSARTSHFQERLASLRRRLSERPAVEAGRHAGEPPQPHRSAGARPGS
ncbi:enoyl-CoA hydratase [Cryptosporangium sp. NPDC051539]|uniref:enoyl-CoA hydratase n=1 Tax=Cryptosporangium sp. NPDC051539 TaxID=3363962 RepID=UPI0037B0C304